MKNRIPFLCNIFWACVCGNFRPNIKLNCWYTVSFFVQICSYVKQVNLQLNSSTIFSNSLCVVLALTLTQSSIYNHFIFKWIALTFSQVLMERRTLIRIRKHEMVCEFKFNVAMQRSLMGKNSGWHSWSYLIDFRKMQRGSYLPNYFIRTIIITNILLLNLKSIVIFNRQNTSF